MSRTKKEGKRSRMVKGKTEFLAIWKRHAFGATERILRRNRKTWTRLGNKIRKRADKIKIAEERLS